MSKLIKPLLVPAFVTLTAVSAPAAHAWERHSATTGPYGATVSSHGSGSCSGGTCVSSQSLTGRYGNTVSRSGSTSCAGDECKGTATYRGPAGRTVTRTRYFQRH